MGSIEAKAINAQTFMKSITFITTLSAFLLGYTLLSVPNVAHAAAGDTLRIHANPPAPAAFQRVMLTIDTPTYRENNILKTESPNFSGLSITWIINGDTIDVCKNTTGCSFMTEAAGDRFDPNNPYTYLVHVIYTGEYQTYSGSIVVTPFRADQGQRDNFTQSLRCSAQTLDMLANDIERTEQMIDTTSARIDAMTQQLSDDIDFLTGLLDFESQYEAVLEDYNTIKDSIDAITSAVSVESGLRAAALALRAIVKVYLQGSIAQNVAHFEKIKQRYLNMGHTLDMIKESHDRYIRNMLDQVERQTALCEKQWGKVNIP